MLIVLNGVKMLLSLLVVLSILYYLVCIFAARRFFSNRLPPRRFTDLPVSILIPLCGTDFEAFENHASFCRQDYSTYQIVFGVRDPQDPAIPTVRRLAAEFPRSDIDLVISSDSIGRNPKVDNLQNMLTRAKHELIVLVDSDIRVGPDYLKSIVAPLCDPRVGLVTCLYRAGKAPNPASKLEAVGITGEFAPGVLVAWLTEGISFALGASVAMRKENLRAIGGFEAVADYLADDYMLGNLMRKAGYEVVLSSYIVETLSPPVRFTDMVKHQIRWSRGIRACRPMGHLGSLVTHGTALALINTIAHLFSFSSLALLALTLAVRFAMAWFVGVRFLGDTLLRQNLQLLPLRDLLSFFVWCAGLFGKKVVWRDKVFTIVEDGKIVPQ
jgi:ceramide glucosyltransferase